MESLELEEEPFIVAEKVNVEAQLQQQLQDTSLKLAAVEQEKREVEGALVAACALLEGCARTLTAETLCPDASDTLHHLLDKVEGGSKHVLSLSEIPPPPTTQNAATQTHRGPSPAEKTLKEAREYFGYCLSAIRN